MSFKNREELDLWIKEQEQKTGEKVVPTLWMPSRFLRDVLPLIPKTVKIARLSLVGTTWNSSSYQKIDEICGLKIAEQLAGKIYTLRGTIEEPTEKQLELIIEKGEKLGINILIKNMILEYNGRWYHWEQKVTKKDSPVGKTASFIRSTKGLRKAVGRQATILDLKSNHKLDELIELGKAFGKGIVSLRNCGMSKTLTTKIDAHCIFADIDFSKL
jgi:hypothetical protein